LLDRLNQHETAEVLTVTQSFDKMKKICNLDQVTHYFSIPSLCLAGCNWLALAVPLSYFPISFYPNVQISPMCYLNKTN
jgi:hypothetical protein